MHLGQHIKGVESNAELKAHACYAAVAPGRTDGGIGEMPSEAAQVVGRSGLGRAPEPSHEPLAIAKLPHSSARYQRRHGDSCGHRPL